MFGVHIIWTKVVASEIKLFWIWPDWHSCASVYEADAVWYLTRLTLMSHQLGHSYKVSQGKVQHIKRSKWNIYHFCQTRPPTPSKWTYCWCSAMFNQTGINVPPPGHSLKVSQGKVNIKRSKWNIHHYRQTHPPTPFEINILLMQRRL